MVPFDLLQGPCLLAVLEMLSSAAKSQGPFSYFFHFPGLTSLSGGDGGALGSGSYTFVATPLKVLVDFLPASPSAPPVEAFPGKASCPPLWVHRPSLSWSFHGAPGSPQESVASAGEAATF